MAYLPVGKLQPELLQRLLERYSSTDDRVLLGSKVGEDAAVIDFGTTCLVAKTDPITFAADDIGWYAVTVNANDIATRGAVPRWFLATVLLPEKNTTEILVETIFAQLASACKKYRIHLCGGHTEVTSGLERPIVVGQMLGEVQKERLIRTAGAQIGDDILLTKQVAVEGTSLLARLQYEELRSTFSEAFLARCRDFLYHPGISIVKEALTAVTLGRITSMHDPTEGGIATGLHEIAEAAGVGVQVWEEAIPIFPETVQLCRKYALDPLGMIASGSLLLTLPSSDTTTVIAGLRHQGFQVAVIGKIVAAHEGRTLWKKNVPLPLPIYHQDEITKIFA